MRKFKLIVPSFVAILVSVLLVAGSTYALFTSRSTSNIAVKSATVEVSADLSGMQTFSITHENTGDLEEAGTIADGDFAATYYYAPQAAGKFAVGGTAVFNAEERTLTLDKIVPGDKVEFTLDSANQSNVDIKYRLTVEATSTSDEALLSVLQFKIGTETFNGLKTYKSEWVKDSETPLADLAMAVIFPLDADDDYQNQSVGYTITLQAVQANAKTSGEKYVELAAVTTVTQKEVPSVIVEDLVNGNQSVATTEVQAAGSEENVSISTPVLAENTTYTYLNGLDEPVEATVGEGGTQLEVSDLYLTVDNETQKVTIQADVDLRDITNDKKIKTLSEDIQVSVFVGKGYADVRVRHDGHLIPTTDEDEGYGHSSSYDSESGYVTFMTKHFSPYEFIGEFEACIGTTYYASLKAALDAALDGQAVNVLRDVDLVNAYDLTKSVTINGNNHSVRASAETGGYMSGAEGRVFNITEQSNLTIVMKNMRIVGESSGVRGISAYKNTNLTLKLDSCVVEANYYAINIAGANTGLKVYVDNNTFSAGWCAIQSWSAGAEFHISNSTFVGNNDKPYNSEGWNNFATIVINGDATNNVWEFENCTIKASQTTGNKQWLLLVRTGVDMSFNNCQFFIQNVDVTDSEELGTGLAFTSNEAIATTRLVINDEVVLEPAE